MAGDDHPARGGEHVEGRGLDLVPVPRSELAPLVDIVGVVAGGGLQENGQRVDDERQRDRLGTEQPIPETAPERGRSPGGDDP